MGSVVHELNPGQHELLHLWNKCFVFFFLGKPLLCLIFVPLLFWEFIPYGICVVPQPVLFNTRIINVLPLILYRLSFCGLILLSLMGLMVCGCNQIIQKCGCRLIGGDEFLIA